MSPDLTSPTDARSDTTLALVLDALAEVAPELDPVDVDAHLQDGLGLDSMDVLNLMVGVARRTGVEIPERDYRQCASVRMLAAYVDSRRG